jgi:hypothetical protein
MEQMELQSQRETSVKDRVVVLTWTVYLNDVSRKLAQYLLLVLSEEPGRHVTSV